MREVKPTQKPVPSSDIKDLFFNSGLLDIWATSLERKYIDRFGNCHLTAAGMEWIFNELVTKFKIESEQALLAAGYAPAGTFQEGAEVVSRNGTVLWKLPDGDGDHYRWDGDLPKQVPVGSTPQSTGGIGKGAWVSVGDASLRSDLKIGNGSLIGLGNGKTLADLGRHDDGSGDSLISVKQPYSNTTNRTQHEKNAETISIHDFYFPDDTDWTLAFQRAAVTSKITGKIIFVPAGYYEISDTIMLYDDGFDGANHNYYRGNGSKFLGEGNRTVIEKTKVGTLEKNWMFTCENNGSKRGLALRDLALIDLTEDSRGVEFEQSIVNSEFKNLFIQARYIGMLIENAFVNVNIEGIIIQGHDDEDNYPLRYGMRVGSERGTSITIDKCHVGHTQSDAYNIKGQYSKIGVLSSDNVKGVNYVFDNFKGEIDVLGAEWSENTNAQTGTILTARGNSIFNIGHMSMLNKVVKENERLFDIDNSQVKINQIHATDNCVFEGSVARLRTSAMLDISYFTQYKYEQFKKPVDYAANTFLTVGNLAGTQYKGRQYSSIHQMLTIPYQQPYSECYRVMGTKSVSGQSGCAGTIYSIRGEEVSRSTLIMDVVCNGNGNIGTSAIAVKRAVSDPVGKNSYIDWYEGIIDGRVYMLLKMDQVGDRNLGVFFSGVTIGRDKNLFRVVTAAEVSDIVKSSIGVMITE
ncbi:hypothetical protein NFC79_06305 [Providencia stuartii]|nr:hypothetical protein NFC79_06305 [Providencia stuartii]